jgi:hypothetical protein
VTGRAVRITSILVALLLAAPALLSAQQSPAEQLAGARRLYDALNYEEAAGALDRLVAGMPPFPIRDPEAARVFAGAYELRARARFFLGDVEGATADFRTLLKIAPGWELPQVSARVKTIFEEVRATAIGRVLLTPTPPDAELELDGVPMAVPEGPVAVTVGPHTVAARRSGCRPASLSFTASPGAVQEVALVLERVSAALHVVTVPAGVDVLVDGTPRGKTEPGILTASFAEFPARMGLPAAAFSKPLVLDDLSQGAHAIQFRRPCHAPAERRVAIDQFTDYRIDPVRLEKAVASVSVDTTSAGASVLLDGEVRGTSPAVLDEVCEGPHVVELRTPWGRHLERIDARPGDRLAIQGTVRPAVALLGINGLPDGYRGPDVRLGLERALAGSRRVLFFAPSADRVQQALKAESLPTGWLAFDRSRRPQGAAAAAITDPARLEIAKRLGRALDVQGVAEATLQPGAGRNEYLVTILSSDSARPDVLSVTLENAPSINAAVLRLDAMPGFQRPTVGISVADVLDLPGPVVIGEGQAAAPRLTPGDLILRAGGEAVADAAAFAARLAEKKAGDTLAVEVRDRSGAAKQAELTVALAPRLLAMSDETWLSNGLVLGLRALLAGASPEDAGGIRLNLAVALMRVGNFGDARGELGQVQLPGGAGVSAGTVQYLLGLCFEALGQPSEAERAWRAAVAEAGSLLTEDGPPVRELAERKLASLAGLAR